MFENMTILQLAEGIKAKKFTSEQVVKHFMAVCEQNKDKNAVIEVFADCLDKAKEVDSKIASGKEVGKLAGVPVAFNDNILVEGKKASCCSNFLKDFVSPYSAEVVKKLLAEDVVPFARTNMDEFALGASTEYSLYGVTKNAFDDSLVAGGPSGGSAVAVALGMVPMAIATDANACAYNGVVGCKATKGTISRYGMVASSSDQATAITTDLESNKFVLELLAGKDYKDGISIDNKLEHNEKDSYKVAVVKEAMELVKGSAVEESFNKAVEDVKKFAEVVEVSIPHFNEALACFYIMGSAETTSSLAKFDGIKSSRRSPEATDLESIYVLSRSEGFGVEAKRRTLLGNFVLSKSNYNVYFRHARKAQVVIADEVRSAVSDVDAIIMPATLGEAFKIGEKVDNPVEMYKEDMFTVPCKLAGIPYVSVPSYNGKNNLPLSVEFAGANCEEEKLFDIAKKFEDVRRDK